MNSEERSRAASRITFVGSAVNLSLTAVKFAAGIYGASGAMIADAAHSMSDLATDVVVLLGFRYIGKPADKTHDYGHGKIETLTAVAVGAGLFIVAAAIMLMGVRQVFSSLAGDVRASPGLFALGAAILSIVVKESLYRSTVAVGKKINSMAIVANAWHHRSDSLSSVGAAVGIAGAMILGGKWLALDSLAAVAVGVLIMKVAYDISIAGLKELLDESLSDEDENRVIDCAAAVTGVVNPHGIRSRKIGANVAVEIHIEVRADMSVAQAHDIASDVEKAIEEMFDGETFVSVHVEPRS
ncbi:MAG: cation diffusion facilitator family transporter [Endomicrobiia bacterium]|nr:cation diffusion facilitator family transporter [Endomicrobiia bacterium]